jgi:hypothetical protein
LGQYVVSVVSTVLGMNSSTLAGLSGGQLAGDWSGGQEVLALDVSNRHISCSS